jgi:alpha-galactosidase
VARFYLINNGSYAKDFDTSAQIGLNPWMNMFFYPGPARARVCRRAAIYDAVVPSSLFMVHYLPDGPQVSLDNNLASLVLGGNGLWGDLPALTSDVVDFWATNIADYKRVIHAVAAAYPRTRGFIGSSPEVHEKLKPEAAAGVVVFFSAAPGTFSYLTQPLDLAKLGEVKGADDWEMTSDGCLKLTVSLTADGARTIFILPKETPQD